jgi:hypothetical protein
MKELIAIQSELKAPKNQWNSFGKYNYRSAEDILEAVKPLLKKHECYLTISDEMVVLGDRYYVKATATLTANDGNYTSTTAYAREEENKKGMDASQITGATSSYARKYALNGLFCIDDTKDSDYTNTHGQEVKPTPSAVNPKETVKKELKGAIDALNKCKDVASVDEVVKAYKTLWTNQDFKNATAKRRKELNETK